MKKTYSQFLTLSILLSTICFGSFLISFTLSLNDGKEELLNIKTSAIPVADFTTETTIGSLECVFTFTGTEGDAPNEFRWFFGDGGRLNSTTGEVTHTYPDFGTYEVDLFVFDADGERSGIRKSVTITNDQIPIADFTAETTPGSKECVFTFTGTDGDAPMTYIWNFGENPFTHSYEKNPTHTYLAFGTYHVTLQVIDADGDSDVIIIDVEIQDEPIAPATPFITVSMIVAFMGFAFLINRKIKNRTKK